jgi:molybdate transport system permease protein
VLRLRARSRHLDPHAFGDPEDRLILEPDLVSPVDRVNMIQPKFFLATEGRSCHDSAAQKMSSEEWQVVGFSMRMALLSTGLLLPPGLLLAWLLARKQWRGKAVVETLVSLPIVLPPVVTGLVLLKLFGRRGPLGHWLEQVLGVEVVFTWKAVILALGVMSMPLFVRAARAAIEEVNPGLEQVARTLGAGEWRVFFTVTLPLARRGVIAGSLLAFARALGEFGATIMVAGNIPGQTTTLSVAIYHQVQVGQDSQAWALAAVAAGLAFVAVWASEQMYRKRRL